MSKGSKTVIEWAANRTGRNTWQPGRNRNKKEFLKNWSEIDRLKI